MKKIKNLLMLLAAIFMFVPYISVIAAPAVIDTISISSEKTSVTLGETLSEFTATSNTKGISVEAYGNNTSWAYTKSANDWIDDGAGTKAAAGRHYGLKLKIDKEEGYQFGSSLTILFNGEDYTGHGYTMFDVTAPYYTLYIDLGEATEASTPDEPGEPEDPEEPTYYTVKFDLNGAKWSNDSYNDMYSEGIQLEAGRNQYVECPPRNMLTKPKLKEFDGFEIGGTRYAPGSSFQVNGNVTVKFLWKDTEENTKDYSVESDDIGIILDFTDVVDKEFFSDMYTLSMYDDEFIDAECEGDAECIASWKEELDAIRELVIDSTKDLGEFIDVYFIDLLEIIDDTNYRYEEGPFKIKIKMTDEMKKYNKFKLVYTEFDDGDVEVTDEVVELTVNGDYLEGTLPHLSAYTLLGSIEEESPKTGDNIIVYIILGIISMAGLASVSILKKKSN